MDDSRLQHTYTSLDGEEISFHPNMDVILSLNDPDYKAHMTKLFRELGNKNKTSGEDEKEVARQTFRDFQKNGGGEMRFFKTDGRTSTRFVEVDEDAAFDKIKSDIRRRMESAKHWMTTEDSSSEEDGSRHSSQQGKRSMPQDPPSQRKLSPRLASLPTQQATKKPSPSPKPSSSSSAVNKKNNAKKRKRVSSDNAPESLPFLANTSVSDIIVEEELRAKENAESHSPSSQIWEPEQVTNFFRGVYVHGWNEWKKVANMVKGRNGKQIQSYALHLEKRSPALKQFFPRSKEGQHGSKEYPGSRKKPRVERKNRGKKGSSSAPAPQQRNAGVARYSSGGAQRYAGSTQRFTAVSQRRDVPRSTTTNTRPGTKPKVVICLGDYIIDTEAEPTLIQPSTNQKRTPADTLPDYFDPSIRPSVPTNNRHIYVPGNRVYARWLNRDDPGSYGTWYPGFIHSSKIAPIQDSFDNHGVPALLYHVKFEDGAEGLDLDTEDIMMYDQYESWLKDLEQYYSLPISEEVTWKRLTSNTRVYAKWIDPTDPELHGSWMSGHVHSSQTWEDESNQWRHSYHVYFDNGDQDQNLQDGDVIGEELYEELLSEKMERSRKKSNLSGFDLITEASKIASPIKTPRNRQHCQENSTFNDGLAKKRLYEEEEEESNNSDDETLTMEDMKCNEVLELRPPSPTHVARLSSTPSPDVHYGVYMKTKPWQLELYSNSARSNQLESKQISDEPMKESGLDGNGAGVSTKGQTTNEPDEAISPQPAEFKNRPSVTLNGHSGVDLNLNKADTTPSDTQPKENQDDPKESVTKDDVSERVDNSHEAPTHQLSEVKSLPVGVPESLESIRSGPTAGNDHVTETSSSPQTAQKSVTSNTVPGTFSTPTLPEDGYES